MRSLFITSQLNLILLCKKKKRKKIAIKRSCFLWAVMENHSCSSILETENEMDPKHTFVFLVRIYVIFLQNCFKEYIYFSDKRKYSTEVFIDPLKRLKFAMMINDDNFSITTTRQSFNLNWVNNENWTQEKCSLAFLIFLRWQLTQMIKPYYLINSIDTATKLL